MDYAKKIKEAKEKAEVLHATMISQGTQESKDAFKTARKELRIAVRDSEIVLESGAVIDSFAKRVRSHLSWMCCGAMIPKKPRYNP